MEKQDIIKYIENYKNIISNYGTNMTTELFEYLVAVNLKMVTWEDGIGYLEYVTVNKNYRINLIGKYKCALVVSDIEYINYDYVAPYIVNATRLLDFHNMYLIVDENVVIDVDCMYLFNKIIRFNSYELLSGDQTRKIITYNAEKYNPERRVKSARSATYRPLTYPMSPPKTVYRKVGSYLSKSVDWSRKPETKPIIDIYF